VTSRLIRAGEVLGVRVLDHVVVAERGYHSFSEAGDLDRYVDGRTQSEAKDPR
jgi:hypothetical protein